MDFAQTSCQSHKAFLPCANSLAQWPLKATECNSDTFYFACRVCMHRAKHTTERDQETRVCGSSIFYWILFHFFKTSGYRPFTELSDSLLKGTAHSLTSYPLFFPLVLLLSRSTAQGKAPRLYRLSVCSSIGRGAVNNLFDYHKFCDLDCFFLLKEPPVAFPKPVLIEIQNLKLRALNTVGLDIALWKDTNFGGGHGSLKPPARSAVQLPYVPLPQFSYPTRLS